VTALLDLLFPPFCPVCRRALGEARRDPLCGSCWGRLERIAAPYCRVCGLPFGRFASADADGTPQQTHLCSRCRRRLPPFAYARSATRYGEVAREALHAFKFGGRRALAAPLADLLAELRASLPVPVPDLVVPVPLHPRRMRERGFNQSLLLARRLGRAWNVPVHANVLARTIHTQPQTALSGEARRINVRAAFALRRPEAVAGRHVVLVDDVFTTGSTVTACVLCLKQGGASMVGVLTVARAL
jgi:ComF family protein